MYEGAREKMPMAAVDDPGESFVAPGQEKQVKWLILQKPAVFTINFRWVEFLGWRSGLLTVIRPKTSARQEKISR